MSEKSRLAPFSPPQKIDVLAHEVGFNTMVAFYRAFKKFTGTTPTLFRKEEKKRRKVEEKLVGHIGSPHRR